MSSGLPPRKPWPMKWIVVAIILFIGGYTYLTLHFRKPGRPYQPYEDMRNRANTGRLLAAGYQRVELTASRPAEPTAVSNTALPAPGGLPAELKSTLVKLPALPTDIAEVHAGTSASAEDSYRIQFRCTLPDDKQQLGGADLYIRQGEVVITPRYERLTGGLESRTRDNVVTLAVPAGTFKAGSYHVTLVGERMSRAWSLQVR